MIPFLRHSLALAALPLLLAACEAPQTASRPMPVPTAAPVVSTEARDLSPREAAANFVTVAETMEPRIEAECRARTAGKRDCDYRIMVDDRPDPEPNAFQTLDKRGRPIVAFNLALIAQARNRDELAFVMGHEAAHYILGHLEAKSADASTGALILGVLAAASGADPAGISHAQDVGANVGMRAYSKEYELAADRLGAIIAWDAGYDPEKGAQFFLRISDPGDVFLGTHPANAARIAAVHRVVEDLRAGRI